MRNTRIFALLAALVTGLGSITASAAEMEKKKLQVFILAGQSNMVGHAHYITIPALLTSEEQEDARLAKFVFKEGAITPGAAREQLEVRIKRDQLNESLRTNKITGDDNIAAAQAEVAKLGADYDARTAKIKEAFAVSKRVYITSIADGHRRSGPLTFGYGGNDEKIGPEFGFGLSLEQKLEAPILLIKTSWGGKSLHYDFRPPSAGPYELDDAQKAAANAEEIKANAGLNYRMMNEAVHAVLGDLKSFHPAYDPAVGHDMAGFVWFQGFNDQFSPAFRENYKNNMIAFVKDVRAEYKTPAMPFVIGVMGTSVTKEEVDKNEISAAQRAAAGAPEFSGTVASVDSYLYYALDALEIFKKGWAQHLLEFSLVGSDRPYHYMGSGKFFTRFGDALATYMVDLMKKKK